MTGRERILTLLKGGATDLPMLAEHMAPGLPLLSRVEEEFHS